MALQRNLVGSGVAARIKSGLCNLLILGDSLTGPGRAQSVFGGIARQWTPDNWRGVVSQGLTGVSECISVEQEVTAGAGAAGGVRSFALRPGPGPESVMGSAAEGSRPGRRVSEISRGG